MKKNISFLFIISAALAIAHAQVSAERYARPEDYPGPQYDPMLNPQRKGTTELQQSQQSMMSQPMMSQPNTYYSNYPQSTYPPRPESTLPYDARTPEQTDTSKFDNNAKSVSRR